MIFDIISDLVLELLTWLFPTSFNKGSKRKNRRGQKAPAQHTDQAGQGQAAQGQAAQRNDQAEPGQ